MVSFILLFLYFSILQQHCLQQVDWISPPYLFPFLPFLKSTSSLLAILPPFHRLSGWCRENKRRGFCSPDIFLTYVGSLGALQSPQSFFLMLDHFFSDLFLTVKWLTFLFNFWLPLEVHTLYIIQIVSAWQRRYIHTSVIQVLFKVWTLFGW